MCFSLSLCSLSVCVSLSLPPALSLIQDGSLLVAVLVITKRLELMIFSYHRPNGWSPYLVCVFYITPVPSSIWKWVDLEWCLPMTGMILQRREREREKEREREAGEREIEEEGSERKRWREKASVCFIPPPPSLSLFLKFPLCRYYISFCSIDSLFTSTIM